jgi:pimeloyl-ACP methyl ester carboxylesterase
VTKTAAPNARMDLYASPQTLVKVGRRRRLNLYIAGEGEPTVILAPGLGGTTLAWGRVQRHVAAYTRAVSFDHAGMGFSDPGPLPRTASAIVADLRAALKAADIAPPYVLVGHSAGGLNMRLFAFLYPQEVVGMVMVDSSSEFQSRRLFDADVARAWERSGVERMGRLAKLAREGTLKPGTTDYQNAVGEPDPALTPALNAALRAQHLSPAYWRATHSELKAFGARSSEQVAAARRPLVDMPLIVLTAGQLAVSATEQASDAQKNAWRQMHDEIAALSSRGMRRTIGCGHNIQVEQPRAVTEAIEEVVGMAR